MKTINFIFAVVISFISFTSVFSQSVASNDIPENSKQSTEVRSFINEFTYANDVFGRTEEVKLTIELVNGEITFTFTGAKDVYFYIEKDDVKKTIKFGNVVKEIEIEKFKKENKSFIAGFNCTNQKGQFIFGVQFNRPWSPWN